MQVVQTHIMFQTTKQEGQEHLHSSHENWQRWNHNEDVFIKLELVPKHVIAMFQVFWIVYFPFSVLMLEPIPQYQNWNDENCKSGNLSELTWTQKLSGCF